MSLKDIVEAIEAARKAGLTDVEADLRAKLKEAMGGTSTKEVAPEEISAEPLQGINASGWVGTPDAKLGAAPGDAPDIPKRSKREVAAANAYFNEAENMLRQDHETLEDMFDGVEMGDTSDFDGGNT